MGKGFAVWLDTEDEGWGEGLANFILGEHDVSGLTASTARSKISGIRFQHLISGENGFTKVGARWKYLRTGLARKNESANRRPPFNAELSAFSRKNLRVDTSQGESEFNRARKSILIGFGLLSSQLRSLETSHSEKTKIWSTCVFPFENQKRSGRGGGLP